MANRNFNLVRGAGYEITELSGAWSPQGNAGTTMPVLHGATWFTVTRTGIGLYTLQLQNTPQASTVFPAVYGATFNVSMVAGGTAFACRLNLPTSVSLDSLVSTTGAIPLITQSTPGGATVDPPLDAASTVYFTLVMKDSTVPG